MNTHIKAQIQNIKSITQLFVNSCEIAAIRDDAMTSKEEKKQIRKIKKAATKFNKALDKIK